MAEDRSVLTRPAPAPDRTLRYGEGDEQVADVRAGDDNAARRPLVMLLHGGFWRPEYDRTHTGPMQVAIARAGWTVAAPEYRRVPGDPSATLNDVAAAVAQLPTRVSGHNGRVILVGHSAGGHLALWAATQLYAAALKGVLGLAPVADLALAHELALGNGAVSAFLGSSPAARADLDPARMMDTKAAITIVHGEDDTVVPIAIAESYVSHHTAARLVRAAGAGHFALIDPLSPAWPVVMAELVRLSG